MTLRGLTCTLLAVAAPAAAQPPLTMPPACVPAGPVVLGIVPRLVQQHKAQYTSDAMRAGIEGTAVLQTLVGADGRPSDICVLRSLDSVYGLDAQAAEALRSWRFSPGTKDGVAVPVRVSVEMQFALQKNPAPQVAERVAAEIVEVFYDDAAHGFRVTLRPVPGLAEHETHCFVPVPPKRRAHVAQTMSVYVQPARFSVDERGNARHELPADEPWLVVLDSGDGHVIFDQALAECRDAPPVGAAVSLLRADVPLTAPRLIKAGDFNTAGATKPGDKGHVEVEFTVLPDGRTADLRVSRSVGARPAVEAAALAAARATTYTPATKGGLPVAVRTTLSWGFHFMTSDH